MGSYILVTSGAHSRIERIHRRTSHEKPADVIVLRAGVEALHQAIGLVYLAIEPWPEARAVLRSIIPLAPTLAMALEQKT
jgi:hypothetical protein